MVGVKTMLAEQGVNVLLARDGSGRGPLHLASRKGHTSLVASLVETGLPVSDADSFSLTPIHHGVLSKSAAVVEALLAAPTARDAAAKRDKEGNTALALAHALLKQSPESEELRLIVTALEQVTPVAAPATAAASPRAPALSAPAERRDAAKPSAFSAVTPAAGGSARALPPSPRAPVPAAAAPPSTAGDAPAPPPPPSEERVAAFHAACHEGDDGAVRAMLAETPALLRAPEPGTGFSRVEGGWEEWQRFVFVSSAFCNMRETTVGCALKPPELAKQHADGGNSVREV